MMVEPVRDLRLLTSQLHRCHFFDYATLRQVLLTFLLYARNDFYNPELITLIISVINSGLKSSFRARSDRHRMMKICQIRCLIFPHPLTPTHTCAQPYTSTNTRIHCTLADFGDIFNLSPIAVLFTQILFEGVSYRYLQQNCFSIYLNCNQNLCLSFQQYMLYVSYRFW